MRDAAGVPDDVTAGYAVQGDALPADAVLYSAAGVQLRPAAVDSGIPALCSAAELFAAASASLLLFQHPPFFFHQLFLPFPIAP